MIFKSVPALLVLLSDAVVEPIRMHCARLPGYTRRHPQISDETGEMHIKWGIIAPSRLENRHWRTGSRDFVPGPFADLLKRDRASFVNLRYILQFSLLFCLDQLPSFTMATLPDFNGKLFINNEVR